jgi:hypothetical protein
VQQTLYLSGTLSGVGDDVAVPALGLCKFVGCVCSLFWLMMPSSVLPCVSVIFFSSSFIHGFHHLAFSLMRRQYAFSEVDNGESSELGESEEKGLCLRRLCMEMFCGELHG